MATTPTYSWPIPDDTDLVKDGAKAIRDLGNAVDATVSSVPTGLVHIQTTTIGSTLSAISLDNVFSANYDVYLLNMRIDNVSTTNTDLNFRFRTGGVDNSGANYFGAVRLEPFTGSSSLLQQNAATFGRLGTLSTLEASYDFTISNPFLAKRTSISGFSRQSGNGHFFITNVFTQCRYFF
jgi:hypothetical protein